MALIGHWSLNGDTRNFTGTIQVAGSITYSDEGKIGKCMDSGSLTLPPGTMNNRSQSIAFWYYNKAASSATATTSQFMGGSSPRDYSLFTYPNNDDLHWDFRNLNDSTIFGGVLSGVLKNLEWTHITIINDNLHFKIYINGVLEQSKIVASWDNDVSEKSFPLLINNPEGRYNDIRIYDHALTDMEIQEIARAKILHYTFDGMQEPTTNVAALTLTSHTPYHSLSRSGQNITMVVAAANTYLTIQNGVAYASSTLAFSGIMKLNGVPYALPGTKASTYQAASASTWHFNNETGYFEIVQTFDNSSTWLFHTHMVNAAVGDVLTIENFQVEQKRPCN